VDFDGAVIAARGATAQASNTGRLVVRSMARRTAIGVERVGHEKTPA
jgi:hypothetical protein